MKLVIIVQTNVENRPLVFETRDMNKLFIGRSDPSQNWFPDIDLQQYAGQLLGFLADMLRLAIEVTTSTFSI